MNTSRVPIQPIEGEWFPVDYNKINWGQFDIPRKDREQDLVRQYIISTYWTIRQHPDIYKKSFEILIPKKDWDSMTIEEMLDYSENLGGHMSSSVETCMMWEKMCNEPDTLENYRMIEWEDTFITIIGGSKNSPNKFPATRIETSVCQQLLAVCCNYECVVPQITRYRK